MKKESLKPLVIIYILFFLLLWWPVYGLAAYILLGSGIRTIAAFFCIALEVLLGGFSIYLTIRKKAVLKKTKYTICLTIICLSYSFFIFSIIYIYLF